MIRGCDQTMPATVWYLISTTHSSGCLANDANEGNGDKPKLLMLMLRQSTGILLLNKGFAC